MQFGGSADVWGRAHDSGSAYRGSNPWGQPNILQYLRTFRDISRIRLCPQRLEFSRFDYLTGQRLGKHLPQLLCRSGLSSISSAAIVRLNL